jgi:hypothetical protein
MQQDCPAPLRPLPILIGALSFGMLAFTGVAAFLAATRGATMAGSPNHLLIVLALLGVSEFLAYHLAIRPLLTKKVRETAAGVQDPEARDVALSQQFVVKTILSAALLEGWGLFGAVIVLIQAQWLAITAPVISALGLALMLNLRDRFAKFREEAVGQRVV